MNIIIAVGSMTVIGIICAVIISVASKLWGTNLDIRVTRISEALPGINCGACGYSGCDSYARAIVNKGDDINRCPPGGNDSIKVISKIMRVKAIEVKMVYPTFYCSGQRKARVPKMDYKGIKTCAAAKKVFGGQNACSYGCLGYGDCMAACKYDAICMDSGTPQLDPLNCVGCTLCMHACPHDIIKIEEPTKAAIVRCKNIEKGAVVRKKCIMGCIACGRCVKECPVNAIIIENNLAVVDNSKCISCKKCLKVCAPECIFMRDV